MVRIDCHNDTYEVGAAVASTATYRLYLAKELSSGEWRLLQVAAQPEDSGGLDRAAFLLERFTAIGARLVVEHESSHPGERLHYERLHPLLVTSFVCPEQGNRRINILRLAGVTDLHRIIPLSNLRMKDRLRIDPETSAWILGRLLKLLEFTHSQGVENRAITPRNILLDPEQHFAVTLDWSVARIFPGVVPTEHATSDIQSATRAVFYALGGDIRSASWPYDGHERYIELLRQLMYIEPIGASEVLDQFYPLVRAEYGNTFHPFTTMSYTCTA